MCALVEAKRCKYFKEGVVGSAKCSDGSSEMCPDTCDDVDALVSLEGVVLWRGTVDLNIPLQV